MEIPVQLDVREALADAARGERAAFAQLVRAHQGMVYSLAYHSTGNAAEAEELAQDVFLELFRNLVAIETPAHLVFWLRRVTSRKCIDWVRKERRQPRVGLADAPEPAVAEGNADTLLSEALQRLVASLPATQRQIVVLRYQEEMEPADIAEVLGMPVNTVKSHLQRSLVLLREKLERSRKVVSS